ncbi:MAG: YggS family pyridoxal phosphate-dependent enzyme [Alphaproteobacteria bacterium]|nr:YggS family pyridoxal phosphate-dependent enzyme [Alphaproteobacteria bacterium]
MNDIVLNLAVIRQRIGAADLIAVSKTQPLEAIIEALAAGQRKFGENRVQEAERKFLLLRPRFPDIELHLIGPLQTNKVRDAVALFDVIQTLDRPKLADALATEIRASKRDPRLSIQVNIGNEPQKAGIAPEALPAFLAYCRAERGLTISGLMCIPPQSLDPRPYFNKMRALADTHKLPHLSMGMSADFEMAVECGATEVRVGSAIFGQRLTQENA